MFTYHLFFHFFYFFNIFYLCILFIQYIGNDCNETCLFLRRYSNGDYHFISFNPLSHQYFKLADEFMRKISRKATLVAKGFHHNCNSGHCASLTWLEIFNFLKSHREKSSDPFQRLNLKRYNSKNKCFDS